MELLGRTDDTVSEIAFKLGFSHRPAFHRAFQRWYGCPPSEYRERHGRSLFYQFHRRYG